MKTITKSAVFAGLFLSSIALLPAATTTSNASFSNLQVFASAHNTPPSTLLGSFSNTNSATFNFSLPKFDSSLGTLQSVQFVFTLPTSQTSATFDVTGGLGVNILSAITLNRSLSLSSAALPSLSNPIAANAANINGTGLASALGFTLGSAIGADGSLTNSASVPGFSSSVFTDATALSTLAGSGNVNFTLTATDLYQFTSTAAISSITWGGTSTYSGNVGIVYTYAAVPEPSVTALLIAAGLLGVVGMRGRKARVA